ncbi:MAG TPA: hypothetical protein VK539_01980 [Myxococcaceae bacterium]|nr:hypothetical protein [Myxococcaceae bacterium]
MSVNGPTAPRVPTTTPTAQTSSTPADTTRFANPAELQEYLKSGPEAMSARYMLAGVTNEDTQAQSDSKIAGSSWVKTFEKGVEERLAKLGANPTKEDVKKAVNAEYFEQYIGKGVVDRASSRIMARVKELMSDTFG